MHTTQSNNFILKDTGQIPSIQNPVVIDKKERRRPKLHKVIAAKALSGSRLTITQYLRKGYETSCGFK